MVLHTLHRATLFTALLFAFGAPAAAAACGLPLRARIPSEQALIVVAGGQQHIITSVQLQTDAPDAAVIFPVPGVPEVDQPPGGDRLFDYLQEATKPTQQVQQVVRWRDSEATGGAAPRGVEVIGRALLGGYDVARLDATDPQALTRWLTDNGYTLPPGAQPILDTYINDGWKFVAVKLADGPGSSGSLAPLRIRFAAQDVVYPMRLVALSPQPIGLQLYLLSDHRMQIDGMEATYAGPVTQLAPAPDSELTALFAGGSYLTSLRAPTLAPETVSSDFVARRAADDTPYRAIETVYQTVSPVKAYGLVLALVCSIGLSTAAWMSSIAIKRRLDRM